MTTDPDGRQVVFDGASHLHLARRKRHALLGQVDAILDAVRAPELREGDPIAGRERFYGENPGPSGGWLLVVVDFNEVPGWIVTVFVTHQDPRGSKQ